MQAFGLKDMPAATKKSAGRIILFTAVIATVLSLIFSGVFQYEESMIGVMMAAIFGASCAYVGIKSFRAGWAILPSTALNLTGARHLGIGWRVVASFIVGRNITEWLMSFADEGFGTIVLMFVGIVIMLALATLVNMRYGFLSAKKAEPVPAAS